jgi:hypothetical protein
MRNGANKPGGSRTDGPDTVIDLTARGSGSHRNTPPVSGMTPVTSPTFPNVVASGAMQNSGPTGRIEIVFSGGRGPKVRFAHQNRPFHNHSLRERPLCGQERSLND